MAKADDDILRDAIIGTEKEVFSEAFGKDELTLDETGDRSLEAIGDGLEGQNEPEDEDDAPDEGTDDAAHPKDEPETPDAEAKAKAEAEAKAKGDPEPKEPQGRVPAGRLREEADKARAAIAERDTFKAQLDAEKAANAKAVSDLNAKLEGVLAAMQKGQQPPMTPAEKPKTPDLFEDPTAFAEHLNKSVAEKFDAFQRQMRDREVNASIDSARSKHGQAFEDAFGALKGLDYRNPDNVALIKRMEASPNPGETIVSWHKRNQAIREVGDDLEGYKARLAEDTRKALAADPEFRKELIASLRGDAETGDNGRPRTAVKLPNSLARTAGNSQRHSDDLEIFDGSESATFASAWSR